MIAVTYWAHILPGSRTSWRESWRPGSRVGDYRAACVPPGARALRNGVSCSDSDAVMESDFVDFVALPEGEVTAAKVIFSLIVSVGLPLALRAIVPPPGPPKEHGDERSPTYGFSRIQTNRAEGQPIGVLYGEHRVGGTIISEFVEVNAARGHSTYHALISLGEGPVKSIAGITADTPAGSPLRSNDDTLPSKIFLEGNTLDNFSGVEAWVRLGSNEQTVVPGFERAKQTFAVDNELTQDDRGIFSYSAIPANEFGSDSYESIWNQYAVGYDTTTEVDGLEVILNFPQGLYRINASNGEVQPSRFTIAVRFAKLDANGDPVTGAGNGGNADDGWVRLPHVRYNLERQTTFQIALPVNLYDPADHVDATPGETLHVEAWGQDASYFVTSAQVTAARRPASWNDDENDVAPRFTFETWIAFDETAGSGPFNVSNGNGQLCLFEWCSSDTNNGVWFGFLVETDPITGDRLWKPHMRVGKWEREHTWPAVTLTSSTSSATKVWHHIVFTHKRHSASTNTSTFYLNGVSYGAQVGNTDIVLPKGSTGGNARMSFGRSNQIYQSDWSVKGWWDETIVSDEFYNQSRVNQRYNAGQGLLHPQTPHIVCGYHFDDSLTDDFGSLNNDLSMTGTGTVPTHTTGDDGIVETIETPSKTRGKYRVQCMRVNGYPSETDDRHQSVGFWNLAITWIDDAFSYPNIAYLALKVRATGQLNTSRPNVTVVGEGRICRVWDGRSQLAPSFRREYTRNPAWCILDAAVNEQYGGSQAFAIEDCDLQSFSDAADHCEKRVYDGLGSRYFYRQEFESKANLASSPIAAGAWSSPVSATVTSNTATAPDGTITADKVEDTDGAAEESRGFTANLSKESSWYVASLYVKKDATATSYACAIRLTLGSDTYNHIFRIDTGANIQGCTVTADDDWWLVKCDPHFWAGGSGTLSMAFVPSGYDTSGTADATLTGSAEIWGASVHRGQTALKYPDAEIPRCFLYVADEDESGAEQTVGPSHWAVGSELIISAAEDPNWVTDAGTTALEITEILNLEDYDAFDRVRVYVCKWFSEDTDTHPSTTFPNLIEDGIDWIDPATNWNPFTGSTVAAEFDDGGTAGGPTTTAPLLSDVLKYTAATSIDSPALAQTLTADPGGKIRLRARAFGVTDAVSGDRTVSVVISDSGQVAHNFTRDTWDTADLVMETQSAPAIEFSVTDGGGGGGEVWIDSVGAWQDEDSSGVRPGGTIQGAEALMRYDAYHDTFNDLWSTLIDMGATARIQPVREGRRLRLKTSEARDPVGLITVASTAGDDESSTFEVGYSNILERPNSITVDFHDSALNWERSTAAMDDPDIEGTSSEGDIRRESQFVRGITRRSQALRHAKFTLNVNRLLTREGSFVAQPSALTYEPGDVIAIGHDLMPWGQSGRCLHDSSATIPTNIIPRELADDFTLWDPNTSGAIDVSANVLAGPFGQPNADLAEALESSQLLLQSELGQINPTAEYVFSVRVKKKVGTKLGLLVKQASGDTNLAEYVWATDTLTQTTTGWTATKIDEGKGWFRLACSIQAQNTNDLVVQIILERTPAAFGDAKIYLADAQWERGTDEPGDYERPGRGLHLDRKITLELDETYSARITSQLTGDSEVADVISPEGVYLRGDLIQLAPSLTFRPRAGDEYIIYTSSQRMLGEVVSTEIQEDTSCAMSWVLYDEDVYDADTLGDDENASSVGSPATTGRTGTSGTGLMPREALAITLTETSSTGPGGLTHNWIGVSWEHDEATAQRVSGAAIFAAYYDSQVDEWGELKEVARATGVTNSARFQIPFERHGKLLRVAVQALGFGGVGAPPEDCPSQVRVLGGLASPPGAVTNLVAHMEGDRITLRWDHVDNHEGVTYEVRMGIEETPSGADAAHSEKGGGWILAQPLGETRENVLGPTVNWATGAGPRTAYKIRARNQHGVYGPMSEIIYGARVENGTILSSTNHWYTYVNQQWRSYGDGWVTDSAPPSHDPTLTNLQRHADGYLEFTSNATTGTYVTAGIPSGEAPGHFEREELLYLHAVVGAICRDPTAIGAGKLTSSGANKFDVADVYDQVGWLHAGNETVEGNLGSTSLPTLRIQVRLIRGAGSSSTALSTATDSDGSTGWIDYKPGLFVCHGAQWRITVTRPATDWDVRIKHFATRAVRPVGSRHYRTPAEEMLRRGLNLG